MTNQEKIEEAHGIWELEVARLAALALAGVTGDLMVEAVKAERLAAHIWQDISNKAVNE